LNPLYTEEEAIINVDITQLEQVILNLCINASHAMTIMRSPEEQQGGILTTKISKEIIDKNKINNNLLFTGIEDGTYWKISINDTGIGMTPEILEKIFHPFFTTKPKSIGTGLGLSMVISIMQQHKGFLDVKSTPGVGTTFILYLPVCLLAEKAQSSPKTTENIIKGQGQILVVDDEKMMRNIISDMLKELGYEVILAENGQEGIELYKKHINQIKIVILDLIMPVKSGKETFLEIIKINQNAKVLMTSGLTDDERLKYILEHGAKGFIQKPYSIHKLSRLLAEIINE
jgi:CheY-like chemotaxis protein